MGDREPAQKVVLVTGASAGIGLALAHILIARDYRVVLTARQSSLPALEALFSAGDRLLLLPLDVTQPDSREAALEAVEALWGGVDILINNAGISYRSVVEHMSREDELLQLRTNYLGPMDLIRRVLPRMRKNRWGRVINVSSVSGMMAMPTMGSYSASKFALEGASEALWYELRPWNVHVTLVQAGFIRSDSYKNVYWSQAAKRSAENPQDDYYIYYKHMGGFVERLMRRALATPESTAKHIVECLDNHNPPLRLPATLDAHFFSALRRLLPRRLYHFILYRNLPGILEWEDIVEELAHGDSSRDGDL